MPTFLSPSVIVRETDASVFASNTSGIIPAFIGTAKKGPVNEPTIISSQAGFVETFGEPFIDSNLGYAVMAFLEQGDFCYVLRVGVECAEGQAEGLASVCIDTSGAMVNGWGRIAVFSGIDYGKIALRTPTTGSPFLFHAASIDDIQFNDIDESSTDGPTSATLTFIDSSYAGAIDEGFIMLITGAPTPGQVLDNATYTIIRQSDGQTVAEGTLNDAGGGVSDPITLSDESLSFTVDVSGSSPLEIDDSFSFQAHPDNRTFQFSVNGAAAASYTMTSTSYTDADSFATAFNALLSGGESFSAVVSGDTLYIRTDNAGERIQLVGSSGSTDPDTEAFALEVGTRKWTWDIPRSYALGNNTGPFNITTQNDRVKIKIVADEAATDLEFSLPIALNTPTTSLANAVNNGGVKDGIRYFNAYALQTSDTEKQLVIVTSDDFETAEIQIQATFSNIETVRFTEEVEILAPYGRPYRVYTDSRVSEPEASTTDPETPASCDDDPSGSDCLADTAYYAGIVGFLVARSPGSWSAGIRATLENYSGQAGLFSLIISDSSGIVLSRNDELSFDPTAERYIGNVLNAGSAIGGINGDSYVQWVERDASIGAGVVRAPGAFSNKQFIGGANGIPTDAIYSSEIDRAIIGSPSRGTGLSAFTNPDEYDISLLVIPGNSSGSVIARAISFCEARGDVLYIVDPPFGLRPQQVIDWHNGILLSDLAGALNTSYAALYWSWVEIFDQFSGQAIFVPPSGYVAGVYARTTREREMWFAPAGLQRGRLTSVRRVEFNTTKGDRDALYGLGNSVNPIANLFQEGITVFGQRTLQRKRSALDRVNVRMLLIYLKKVLPRALRSFLFEPNTPGIWPQVRSAINSILIDVSQREGIEGFQVIVDESNNTPQRRDNNELWVSVAIRPVKSIEFIVLNLGILRSSQSFAAEEILSTIGVQPS